MEGTSTVIRFSGVVSPIGGGGGGSALTLSRILADLCTRRSPKDIKAFYMPQNEDEKTVAAMDLVVPRVKWGCDLQSKHERYITEITFAGSPVILGLSKGYKSLLHAAK